MEENKCVSHRNNKTTTTTSITTTTNSDQIGVPATEPVSFLPFSGLNDAIKLATFSLVFSSKTMAVDGISSSLSTSFFMPAEAGAEAVMAEEVAAADDSVAAKEYMENIWEWESSFKYKVQIQIS